MGLFDWVKKIGKGKEQTVENEEIIQEEIIKEDIVEEDIVEEDIVEEDIVEELMFEEEPEDIIQEEEVQEEPEDIIQEEEVQEEPEDIIQEDEIQEEPENIIQEEPENIIQEEEVQEEPENITQEEEVQEEPENIIQEDEVQEEPEDIIQEEPKKKTIGLFAKIKSGLEKTRTNILSGVESVLKGFSKIDEELYEELEEALIISDIGVDTSVLIISKVKELVKKEKVSDVEKVKELIARVITEMLESDNDEFTIKSPAVILVIGVNGVGKTTTIGKLTNNFKNEGKKVILAAADTFRAAAIDQLQIWGDRSGVDVIKHQENSDPAAVVFDAIQAAKARKADILICDTAGRLHNKKNLMEELKKISRIISREYGQAQMEVLLVLDSTTGQNALQQAKLFKEVADITGIVLTKLDGTAKGGIVIAIKNELEIPVRFIGVGEGIDDLQPFNANEFAKALFDNE